LINLNIVILKNPEDNYVDKNLTFDDIIIVFKRIYDYLGPEKLSQLLNGDIQTESDVDSSILDRNQFLKKLERY